VAGLIPLSMKEANLLRTRLQQLLRLRSVLLTQPGPETVHDLRVASRRLREVLDYLQPSLPPDFHRRSRKLAKRVTRTLGSLRETEVNISLLQQSLAAAEVPVLAAEVMLGSLESDRRKLEKRALKEMARAKFRRYEAALNSIAASRLMPPTPGRIVLNRRDDLLQFMLPVAAGDEQLHGLRILTKKFRYAVEIYDSNLGRFLNRIKSLQDLLGAIHDWFILQVRVQREWEAWHTTPGVSRIPEALGQAVEGIRAHKLSLQPRVPSLYLRVTGTIPPVIRNLQEQDGVLVFHAMEEVSP
jgi:CHAD domain-containing protein